MKLPSLVAAVSLAGALLVPTAPAGAAPAPVERSDGARSAVTPGSYLASVERGPNGDLSGINPRSEELVLISPTGQQQIVYTQRIRHYNGFALMDWSADGATALLALPH